MKLKFKDQQFQTDATNAVCDVFDGQPPKDIRGFNYTLDTGRTKDKKNKSQTLMALSEEGYCNPPIMLTAETLLENVRKVQRRAVPALKESEKIEFGAGHPLELEVEMETGTGKTFVYTKTMFELNKRYGWSKFIVIVPSVAIREGVRKSLEITAEKFIADYGKRAKVYVYDSARPQDIHDFSTGADIEVLVMNYQAFASTGKDHLRIYQALDDFQSRVPMDMIAANRPILILDEPQRLEGKTTTQMLPKFKPLMILRYSATHKTIRNLVYRLDAIDAFEQKRVKKINPICIELKNQTASYPYLYLSDVRATAKGPEAVLELKVKVGGDAVIKRKVVRDSADLYELSNKIEAYKGYRKLHIEGRPGYEKVVFPEKGEELELGQTFGFIEESGLRRIQIQEAVKAHLDKEELLFAKGIKVLTLFFIDEVAKYRVYESEKSTKSESGEYARMFEEAYKAEVERRLEEEFHFDPALKDYWKKSIESAAAISDVHAGYFAQDKNHRIKNSEEKRNGTASKEDTAAYDFILKEKEKLLEIGTSTREQRTRFIFSHSALREGWDNPNVFVICPLKQADTANVTARRQEIGRGLRLCVNQQGERQDDPATVHDINILSVVATENFSKFVGDLQKEILEACESRPKVATAAFFTNQKIGAVSTEDGGEKVEHTISATEAQRIFFWLATNGYVDADGNIQKKWREDKEVGQIAALPFNLAPLEPLKDKVVALVSSVYDPSAAKNIIDKDRREPLPVNANKDKFLAIWNRINRHAIYKVAFDSDELVANCIAALDHDLMVPKTMVTIERGEQKNGTEIAKTGNDVAHETIELDYSKVDVRYDLIGKIADETNLTRQTVSKILCGVHKETFAKFRNNPERFIAEASRIINEQKGAKVVKNITYDILSGAYKEQTFTENQYILRSQKKSVYADGSKLKRCIYDYIPTDAQGERDFAKDLDTSELVDVYAKLPRGFKIPTPVGDYNPDWAISFVDGRVKYVYFVAETKGSMSSLDLRGIEGIKIQCAEKFFEKLQAGDTKLRYRKVDGYNTLLGLVEVQSSTEGG